MILSNSVKAQYSYTPDNPLGDVLAFTLGRGRALQGSVEYQF